MHGAHPEASSSKPYHAAGWRDARHGDVVAGQEEPASALLLMCDPRPSGYTPVTSVHTTVSNGADLTAEDRRTVAVPSPNCEYLLAFSTPCVVLPQDVCVSFFKFLSCELMVPNRCVQ